ncbi:L-threonylcarbamoyladenylate synthase [Propionivibrio sp.]|uniref:L-threonylcarbamoyladenylate synthase n=1 Tax=Propionivibrio sp. TaxID=2212460 RepID=UPI0025E8AF72|nr:L-threonylcarbamoyladenylate synthase [Propionivibrio sp.]MBK7356106.1 threonylcarbamoyl-AMP synthase [Propionivibrio sp.]MBK8400226.1 threonylcarbamoyl-AMP synthase [Propionivibrio sp.]MBK8744066.1 threonylcarbamoyl-AMP synthase [Propionivibrio sp.]MBK8893700.1 threonylcarbamoyl-AMP synthase [Propionivibrio sp.]MBL0207248.1 threonylcarbamoyl-AMP synthase [Propionivibrio sp.]
MTQEPQDVARAVKLLQAGELVAFPTETVYGLGADAANPAAVARIFTVKGRPVDHPLIVHLPGAAHLDRWASTIPATAWELAEAFWPGPLTLILKRSPEAPNAVTGGQETIGVRVPAHPLALDLLRTYAQAGGGRGGMCGIAAPSANRFGRISPTTAAHVHQELGESVGLVLDGGPCSVGIESTIIDLSRDGDLAPRLLRPGRITAEQIALVIGVRPVMAESGKDEALPRVPGALESHYAPQTPLRLVQTPRLATVIGEVQDKSQRCGLLARTRRTFAVPPHVQRQLPDEATAYARGLYAALRELDQLGNDFIVVEDVPGDPAWAAVADRLRRAAGGAGNKD